MTKFNSASTSFIDKNHNTTYIIGTRTGHEAKIKTRFGTTQIVFSTYFLKAS